VSAWAELLNLGQYGLWHGFLIFLRVGAALSLMPGFGEQSVPVRVKLVLSIVATLVIAPIIPSFHASPWGLSELVRFGATETLSGLLFGVGLRFFVMALQTAGTIAAQSTCSIPDDYIAPRRSALFMARWVLTEARDGRATC
jgi:flagellar biosynthetic protein FliR